MLKQPRALATLGNFGRAAEASNISQPALSVQIRTLEESLGGRLIERQSRASVLTPLGREVLTRAEDILRRAKLLEAAAREQVGLAGTLNLGLIPTVAPYLLPGVLAALRAQVQWSVLLVWCATWQVACPAWRLSITPA